MLPNLPYNISQGVRGMNKVENTTLDNILKEAKIEFMDKGYQNASLRVIVKKAGVTTGAFYGYYKNKAQLFDALVEEQYDYTIKLYKDTLDEFFSSTPEEQSINMIEITYKCMSKLKDYMYENFDVFKMILCCSEGTKYKHMIHEMAEMDIQATRNFSKTIAQVLEGTKEVNPVLEHILTSGMFTGFFELVVHNVPREEADEYINQLLEFYSAGWGKIMGF